MSMKNKKLYIFGCSIFLFVVGGFFIVEYIQDRFSKYREGMVTSDAREKIFLLRSELEAQVYYDIYSTSSFALMTMTIVGLDVEEKWELLAKELMSKANNITALGIAPDDVIEYIFPLEENESATSLDYRTQPKQWEAIERAKNSKASYVSQPVELVQGGWGLIIFNPLYSDPPYNKTYWGNSAAVLDIERLFLNSGMFDIDSRYNISVRYIDIESGENTYLEGTNFDVEKSIATAEVNLPNQKWIISISLSENFDSESERNMIRLVGLLMLSLISILFITIYYQYSLSHRMSMVDELTGVANRRYFMSKLKKILNNTNPEQDKKFTLLSLDLDEFKSINDKHGHSYGDKVLIEVSRRVVISLRKTDIVARVGGDEFLVLLLHLTDKSEVEDIIHRIKCQISEQPILVKGRKFNIKVSIGYCVYLNHSVEDILHEADLAMYSDKEDRLANVGKGREV